MTIDIARLRELAGKATPGDWYCSEYSVCATVAPGSFAWVFESPDHDLAATGDLKYVAEAQPAVILALLDRLEAAERVVLAAKNQDHEHPIYSAALMMNALAAYDRVVGKT